MKRKQKEQTVCVSQKGSADAQRGGAAKSTLNFELELPIEPKDIPRAGADERKPRRSIKRKLQIL